VLVKSLKLNVFEVIAPFRDQLIMSAGLAYATLLDEIAVKREYGFDERRQKCLHPIGILNS
jgi:hypothetical protein